MRTGKVLLVMVAVLAMAGAAGAQILVNGGFEDPLVTNTTYKWDYFASGTPALGWNVEWYQGSTSFNGRTRPADAYLELHKSGVITGVDAQEGNQYAELDTDWDGPGGGLQNEPASVYIYQDIETCYGADYVLTFHYSQRPGEESSLGVYVNDSLVFSDSPSGGFGWIEETVSFTATGATTRIGFKEEGSPDSFGVFLDGVSLEQVSSCPKTVTLCEAQYEPIGGVTVYEENGFLYVTFAIDSENFPNRYLDEVHVAVATSEADLPQTKKGNPIPGQFPYSCDPYDPITPMDTMCTAEINLAEIGDCGPLYVAAHASVIQVDGDGCQSQGSTFWANTVGPYDQGTLKTDLPITDTTRTAPEAVFDLDGVFYSLGFDLLNDGIEDGYLTVGFGAPVYDGIGNDIVVQEVTFNRPDYDEELADVFGVQDGTDYYAGTVSNQDNGTGLGSVGLNLPPGMTTVDFVKLVDATDPSIHNNAGDGYDVDAIGACYLYQGDETAWGAACAPADGTLFTEKGNWGTFFTYEGLPVCD